jgi:serralysin
MTALSARLAQICGDFSMAEEIKICTQMPIDPKMIEEAARRAVAENPANATAHRYMMAKLNLGSISDMPPREYLALPTGKMWMPGRTLRVKLRGGSDFVRSKVKQFALEWLNYANIKLVFVDDDNAELRVGFDPGGSWSHIGTDNLTIPTTLNTMNFGWFVDNTPDDEFSRTVIHEFGHALGCIHEHQSPDANIPWNKDAVYAYYLQYDGWNRAQVDVNIFDLYSSSSTQFSQFDSSSIMLYSIPASLTYGGFSIPPNRVLSSTDKQFIGQMYPEALLLFYQQAGETGQIVLRGTNDLTTWTTDVPLNGVRSFEGVAAAAYRGKTYLIHQNRDYYGSLKYNVADGGNWSEDRTVANTAGITGNPAAIAFNDKLYCLYQGVGNNGRVLYNVFDGSFWSGELPVQNTAGMSSSPCVVVFGGKLYCFYEGVGNNGRVLYNVFDGVAWSGEQIVSNTSGMSSSPGAAVFNGKIYLFYQGVGNGGVFLYNVFDGNAWSGQQQVPNTPGISSQPAAFAFGGKVYCFHQGVNNNGQLWFSAFDGATWSGDTLIPNISLAAGAGPAVFPTS